MRPAASRYSGRLVLICLPINNNVSSAASSLTFPSSPLKSGLWADWERSGGYAADRETFEASRGDWSREEAQFFDDPAKMHIEAAPVSRTGKLPISGGQFWRLRPRTQPESDGRARSGCGSCCRALSIKNVGQHFRVTLAFAHTFGVAGVGNQGDRMSKVWIRLNPCIESGLVNRGRIVPCDSCEGARQCPRPSRVTLTLAL